MKSAIDTGGNPMMIGVRDALRLHATQVGSVAACTVRKKRVSLLVSETKSDTPCVRCALHYDRNKRKNAKPLCDYWRLCFASKRSDNKSVVFTNVNLQRNDTKK